METVYSYIVSSKLNLLNMGKDKYTGYTYVALSYDKYPF